MFWMKWRYIATNSLTGDGRIVLQRCFESGVQVIWIGRSSAKACCWWFSGRWRDYALKLSQDPLLRTSWEDGVLTQRICFCCFEPKYGCNLHLGNILKCQYEFAAWLTLTTLNYHLIHLLITTSLDIHVQFGSIGSYVIFGSPDSPFSCIERTNSLFWLCTPDGSVQAGWGWPVRSSVRSCAASLFGFVRTSSSAHPTPICLWGQWPTSEEFT